MECSNKGTCDRSSGLCTCYPGYDGVACQRASCPGFPNSCSGHGVCKTIKQLAAADNGNFYDLWDKDKTMGCECDNGYSGPDCSLRTCKVGVDPLYLDDTATIKYSIFDFATLSTAYYAGNGAIERIFSDGQYQNKQGYFAIRFYDAYGEDWVTVPIVAGASCAAVVSALESLPNDVVPPGKTYCTRTAQQTLLGESSYSGYDAQNPASSSHPYMINYKMAIWEANTPLNFGEISSHTTADAHLYTSSSGNDTTKVVGYIYRLKFFGNPGALQEPEIEIYLDGKRPSLVSSVNSQTPTTVPTTSPPGKVITKVWTDGQQGENNDYFADHCDGVSLQIGKVASSKTYYLTGMTTTERSLLKACLGASDFDSSNNIDVYNWDHGSKYYPHLIKLVRTITTYTDGGYYAAVWFDTATTTTQTSDSFGTDGTFRLLNPFFPPDAFSTDSYEVYTTKGTLALTSNYSQAIFSFASHYAYMVNATYDNLGGLYDGDISCEVGMENAYKFKYIFHCVNKTDLITFLNWDQQYTNPPHINLYTTQRLAHIPLQYDVTTLFGKKLSATPTSGDFKIGAKNMGSEGAHFMTHVITTDLSTNWGVAPFSGAPYHVYKFFPAVASTYNYVAPCANRGVCDDTSGSCSCFPGYTNDNCDTQSSLHV